MKLRAELEALPARLHFLPVDERGYPVPWFVAWRDGKPEFRAMDGEKWVRAVAQRLCWVCGEQLGNWLTFVIGPPRLRPLVRAQLPVPFPAAHGPARGRAS